ncbi:MAG: complement resistance protein TraT [Nitrospiraceae bacterium]
MTARFVLASHRLASCLVVLAWFSAGCSNVLTSGLMNDSSILLPPSGERTIYVQLRNTSENQQATPSDLSARLGAQGYHVVTDPAGAAYWLQAQILYCHKAGEGITPESVAKSGFGTGLGSGGTPLSHQTGGGDMQAMVGRMMAGMPDVNAMMRMAMSGRGGYMGGGPPPKDESVTYLCVADILVTERGKNGQPSAQRMRSVAHVLQKGLNIEEATPIIRDKLAIGMVGPF